MAKTTNPVYALIGAGDAVVARLREIPAQRPRVGVDTVRELPEQAQAAVNATVEAAVDTYGDLAERGRRLVTRIRRQQATQDLAAQARSTVRRTKAAGTTARKSATRTRKAAAGTTRTVRKNAAATRSAAKGAATSAQKTAEAAAAATEAAAEKVGS